MRATPTARATARIDGPPAAATIRPKRRGEDDEAGTVRLCQGSIDRARDRLAGPGRRTAPRRRTEPDRHPQYAIEPPRIAGRYQRNRRARSDHVEERASRTRRARTLRASRALGRARA